MIGLSFPEYEAKRYRGRLRKEGILLSVHCDDLVWEKRAKAVLSRTGAEDIASTSERKADFAISDKPISRRAEHPVARPIKSTEKLEEEVEAGVYDHRDHEYN